MDLAEEARWRETFRDALFELLSTAGDAPTGRSITAAAAQALRMWLIEAPLELVWRHVDVEGRGTLWAEGSRCDDLDLDARPLSEAELARALNALDDVPPATSDALRTWFAPDVTTWRLVLTRRPAAGVEEHVALQLPASADPDAVVRRAWLAGWRQGAQELLTTLQALRTATTRPADALGEPLPAPTAAALTCAAAVAALPRSRHALPRLTSWAWRVLHAAVDARALVPGHVAARALAAALRRHAAGAPGGRALRLCAAGFDVPPNSEPQPARRAWRAELDAVHGGDHLGAWLWVAATSAVGGPPTPDAPDADGHDDLWAWIHRRGGPALAAVIAEAGGELSPHRAAGWFALTVLPHVHADRSPRRWRRRSAWLTIAAAAVRPTVEGAPPDAPDPAAAHPDALLELVTVYAHACLGLPHRLDLLPWLSRPGAVAAAHRHHSLDAFLMGHLLLDVQQARAPALVTPSVRRAHLVAALLHDVGAALVHRLSDAEPWPDGLPPQVTADLTRRLHDARLVLVEACLADLRGAGVVAADAPHAEPHGVVGAWVVSRVGLDAGLAPDDLLQAARAVLVHGDTAASLDGQPVAALLAITDQLLEWDPASPTRARRVERASLEGLSVSAQAATVVPTLSDAPRLVVHLRSRARADAPTWQAWLTVCQQLARVRMPPAVRLIAPLDVSAEGPLATARRLERLAWRPPTSLRALALDLRAWLADPDRFGAEAIAGAPVERLDAHPLRHGQDVRAAFADLEAALADPNA